MTQPNAVIYFDGSARLEIDDKQYKVTRCTPNEEMFGPKHLYPSVGSMLNTYDTGRGVVNYEAIEELQIRGFIDSTETKETK